MQEAPSEVPETDAAEQNAVEESAAQEPVEEQTEEHEDKDMDAIYATMLAHVMLAASCGFGMLIWSLMSDAGVGFAVLLFYYYFMPCIFWPGGFLIKMRKLSRLHR